MNDDTAAIEAALQPVQRLARGGKKIHAIKELRTLGGFGLKDAKDAVEHFIYRGDWRSEDMAAIRAYRLREGPEPGALPTFSEPVTTASAALVHPVDIDTSRLRQLLLAGKKIQAIKAYREIFGVGLKDAKDAVESLDLVKLERAGTDGIAALLPHAVPTHAAPIVAAAANLAAAPERPLTLRGSVSEPSSSDVHDLVARVLGREEAPLVELPAESGLYKGYLVVTQSHVVFATNRFGEWELTENLRRGEIDRVEVREDPFGADLVVQAGYHTAHFSELNKPEAERLRDYLVGKLEAAAASASPLATGGERTETAVQGLSGGEQMFAPPPPMVFPERVQERRKKFSVVKVLFLALFAAVPAVVVASLWRWIPMQDFPRVAFEAIFWSALGVGGGLIRGRAGPMLQAGFVAGLVDWALNVGLDTYRGATLVSLAIVGLVWVKAFRPRGYLWGALLALPAMALNALLGFHVLLFDELLPTTAFSFWFVAFATEDLVESRAAKRAAA